MYYVLWRIDGPFNLTAVPAANAPSEGAPTNEWLVAAIKTQNDCDKMQPNGGDTDEDLAEQIAIATDSDHPHFMGYEMPTIFHGDNIKFIC